MPQYKLTYFPIRGLAEQIRLLLIDNKIEFEDDRIKSGTWQDIKSQFVRSMRFSPCSNVITFQIFDQVPCLYDNGKAIAQTGAIMRHLGRKHGKMLAFLFS